MSDSLSRSFCIGEVKNEKKEIRHKMPEELRKALPDMDELKRIMAKDEKIL